MWEAGKRLFCTATGEYMREATITIFILLFHLILPGASDGGKDVAYADAFILALSVQAAVCGKNRETKRHSRADYAVLPLIALSGFVLRIHYIHGSGIVVE